TNYPFPTRPSRITVQPVESRHNSQFSLVSPVLRSCQCERNLDNRAVLQDKLPLPYPPIPHNCPAGRLSAQQSVQFGQTTLPTRPSRITVQPVESRHNSQFSLVSPVLRSCQCRRNLHNRAVLQDKPPLPTPSRITVSQSNLGTTVSSVWCHLSCAHANVIVTLTIEPCCRTNYPFPTRPSRITVQPVDSRHNSQFSLVSPVLRSCQCERNLDNRAVLQDKLPLPYPPNPHNCSAGRLSAQQSVQFGVICLALMQMPLISGMSNAISSSDLMKLKLLILTAEAVCMVLLITCPAHPLPMLSSLMTLFHYRKGIVLLNRLP
ncbi:hypothetical protein J6590_093399, partial [Homalodisca vitripennis]